MVPFDTRMTAAEDGDLPLRAVIENSIGSPWCGSWLTPSKKLSAIEVSSDTRPRPSENISAKARLVRKPADPKLASHLGLTRQWLHAVRLAFEHPSTGREVIFESAYAPDLQHALDVLVAES